MTGYVVDASVVLKWIFPETGSEAARRLNHPSYRLHAPAVITLEVGNVLCKKRRRGEIGDGEATAIWDTFGRAPIRRHADERLASVAFELALRTNQSLYDCLYLALAIQLDAQFITDDHRFVRALKDTPYHECLLRLDALP